jgi:CheY-like chemotaxis protein
VDDEPGLAKTLKFLLDDVYDTEAFTSGSAALERILEGDPFDIVLCDLMMPNVSGIDLYHRVAETRPGQEARIFFMTGGAFTPRGLAFLEQVPNPRLEKPFSPEDFDRAIEHWRLTMGTHL